MSVRIRGEDVSEAWLRTRMAARTWTVSVHPCACRVHFLCNRRGGGISEVPDARRERRKVDVEFIVLSCVSLSR